MSIVTKTGDRGETGLYGGKRVPKDSSRIETYGTVDELNAVIGCVLAQHGLTQEMAKQLTHLQHLLFRVGADLATPTDSKAKTQRIEPEHVTEIEKEIIVLESSLAPQQTFILPGGSEAAALLHLARTVCRRAERCLVHLKAQEPVNEQVLIFLNRLSDYLFLLARKANASTDRGDVEVRY